MVHSSVCRTSSRSCFSASLIHSVACILCSAWGAEAGILASQPDGSGRIVVSFDCEDFFKDLEIVLNMPPQTEEQDMQADACAFLQRQGIKLLEEE